MLLEARCVRNQLAAGIALCRAFASRRRGSTRLRSSACFALENHPAAPVLPAVLAAWLPAGPCARGGNSLLQSSNQLRCSYYARLILARFETQTRSALLGQGVLGALSRASQAACWSALCCPLVAGRSAARTPASAQLASKLGPPKETWHCRPCLGRWRPRCGRGLVGADCVLLATPAFYWRAAVDGPLLEACG